MSLHFCRAALNIKGEHYACDWPTDKHGKHPGWAHSNALAQAIWIDDPDKIRKEGSATMYSVIWKYPLLLTDEQTITMPQKAAPLYVDIQGDTLCLWAMVDPKAESMPQKVHVYGTGNPMGTDRADEYHIGSVQHTLRGQTFVWHCFWVVE